MGEPLCGTYECSMDLRDTRALQETCIKCFFYYVSPSKFTGVLMTRKTGAHKGHEFSFIS